MPANPIKIRHIIVCIGDVFGRYPLVVVGHEGRSAVLRSAATGRTTKIRKERLQLEYPRASERAAAAAHRDLQRLDKERGRKNKRSAASRWWRREAKRSLRAS